LRSFIIAENPKICQNKDINYNYYNQRGWDQRGIPTRKTAEALDLKDEMAEVEKYTKLE